MTTNGYLLTPPVADKLLAWGVSDFQVTVDGPAACHDQSRPTREGGATFATIFANLVALAGRPDDFMVAVRVNFDEHNKDELEQLLDQAEAHFRSDPRFVFSFHAVGRWGGDNDANLAVCGREDVRAIQLASRKAARERDLSVAHAISRNVGLGSHVCYAARPYSFVIGAAGQVMKCTVVLDKKDVNLVGRLGPDGDLALDEDKMALWTEPAFEQDAGCQSCPVVPACNGMHCPLVRIRDGVAPCPEIKTTAKQELLEEFRFS